MTAATAAPQATDLVFTIAFHGPFRIARGEASGGADLTVDHQTPLPASSLKGLMRAAANNVLGIGDPWLFAVFGADTTSDETGLALHSVLDQWCWNDPEIDERSMTIDRAARIRLEPDGTVMDRHLLIGEQVWVNRPVSFTVSRLGPLDPGDLDAHRLVLRASARAVLALGGQRRRGFGWVTISDGQEWTVADSRALLALADRTPAPVGTAASGARSIDVAPSGADLVRLTYRLLLRSVVTAGAGSEVGNGRRGHQVIPGSVIRGALAAAWMRDHGTADSDHRMAALFERDLSVGPAVPVGSWLVPLSLYRRKYQPDGFDQWSDGAAVAGKPPDNGLEFGRGWSVPAEHTVRITRTALNPDGTAKTGGLFSETGLRAGVVAVGELCVSTDDVAALQWLRRPRTLRVGGRRSTGGLVDWTVHEPPAPVSADQSDAGTMLVRCLSPIILVDEYGAPAADRATVAAALSEQADTKLTVEREWARTGTVEGWHTASGLPKVADWAIEAGSVFEVSGLSAASAERLRFGIGLRRQEGFGRVEVCTAGSIPQLQEDPALPDPGSAVPQDLQDQRPTTPRRSPVSGPAEATSSLAHDCMASTPAAPVRPDSEPEPAPAAPVSIEQRVSDLVAAVGPADAPTLLKGMANEARRIANFRTSGMDAVAQGAAKSALKQAWARTHAESVQNLIVGLLQDENVSEVRDFVTRRVGEQQ